MFRFITIKDPHLKFGFHIPNSRKDTFFEEIYNKWDFVKKYMKNNNITVCIVTGDLLDEEKKDKWKFFHYLEIQKFLIDFKSYVGEALYTIRGNHDEINGLSNHIDTPFGEYIEQNLINYFGDDNTNFENKLEFFTNNKKINIYGIDFKADQHQLTDRLNNLEFELEIEDNKDYNICVLHENVVETKGNEKFNCKDYKFLLQYKYINMWILGHYHRGYPIRYIDGVYFINIWNMTRLIRDNYTLNNEHKPQLADVTINYNNNYKIKIDIIDIPHLPYEQSFKEEIVDLLKNVKKQDFSFLKNISLCKSNMKEQPIKEILEEIQKEKKFSKESVDLVLKYLKS